MVQCEDVVFVDGLERCLHSGGDVGIRFDFDAEATKGLGHEGEFRFFQLRSRDTFEVVAFLVGTDGAVLPAQSLARSRVC